MWKNDLESYANEKNWSAAIALLELIIKKNPFLVEPYIQIIYLLHNLLLEEEYSIQDHDYFARLLKEYFDVSYRIFPNDLEYLLFIGLIMQVAEWYFGQTDTVLALEMHKKAFVLDQNNILCQWAYLYSISRPTENRKTIANLAQKILHNEQGLLDWIDSKGFPGKYLKKSLNWSLNDWTNSTFPDIEL